MRPRTREEEKDLNRRIIDEFRARGGVVGGPFEGHLMLLLTTRGAKTGIDRIVPLAYFSLSGNRYIVGSAAGRDAHPAWVWNIRANPNVQIEVGAAPPADAVARELTGSERDQIFETLKQQAPAFAAYEAATERVMPVFEIGSAS